MLYKNTSYQINAIIEYDNEFNFHFVCFTALTIYGIETNNHGNSVFLFQDWQHCFRRVERSSSTSLDNNVFFANFTQLSSLVQK